MKNYKIGKCQRCGKEILLTVHNKKYCKECYFTIRKEQNKRWYKEHPSKAGYKLRICLRCGKEFQPISSTQKYCEECQPIVKKEWRTKYYLEYHDELIKKRLEYHKEHLEKEKQYRKQYESKNREQINKQRKEWLDVHSEQKYYNKEYLKQYRQTEHGKEVHKIANSKRDRNLDFIPLNENFEGAEAHHIDRVYIIYMPKNIHHSIYHSVLKDINMDIINAIAFNYLGE